MVPPIGLARKILRLMSPEKAVHNNIIFHLAINFMPVNIVSM